MDDSLSHTARLTVGQIAGLAGVRSSAVSNWRKRHADFPPPTESTPAGDLFELPAVLAWLRRHGKSRLPADLSADLTVSSLVAALRSKLGIDRSVLLVMQLIAARRMRPTQYLALRNDFAHDSASGEKDAINRWNALRTSVSDDEPELSRVLELSGAIDEAQLRQAVLVVGGIDDDGLDWGHVASVVLSEYLESVGARGGYFGTSQSVASLAVGLIEDVSGTIYDPAAGLAMVLAEAWRFRLGEERTLVGQEADEHSWRLGYLHLAATGAPFKFLAGDTLRDDRLRGLQADAIVLDPPYGQKVDIVPAPDDDRWRYGVSRTSTEWIWAQHLLSHLANDGIGVMLMPLGALVRSGIEGSIRRGFVDDDFIDIVIELPPGLNPSVQVPLALVVFDRERPNRSRRTLFIDGRQLGTTRRGRARELSAEHRGRILEAVMFWRMGLFTDEPRFASEAPTARIADNGYDLSPSRYIGYEAISIGSIDDEPIEQRLERLLAGLDSGREALDRLLANSTASASSFERVEHPDWPSVRLGDLLIAEPRTGVRQDSGKQEGPQLPFVSTRLVSGGPGYLESIPVEVTETNVRDRLVSEGDLLLVSRGLDPGGAARCATVRFQGEASYAESLMRLRFDRLRVEPDFIRLFLTSRSGRALLAAITTGSVIANLRASALVEIRVPLPPLEEQRRIAAAVADVERGVAALARTQQDTDALLDTLREGIASGMYTRPEG